ncbi:MAG: 1,4-alpha-glucan branching protein GlgB [Myxococcales bacterium]|nr:1,4-alpha-glucan branching protein GlgB [Myxococcales bacterium]
MATHAAEDDRDSRFVVPALDEVEAPLGSRSLSELDLHLFQEGTHRRAYRAFGAHLADKNGEAGTTFAVWAPNAARVSVIGDFNAWDGEAHPLERQGSYGVWQRFVPGVAEGARYKYDIQSEQRRYRVKKADPFGFHQETAPATASIVCGLEYAWGDGDWMKERRRHNALSSPISIYEVHLGSWMRVVEEGNRSLSYRELGPRLAEHVERLGFTHVEILPVMEHPFFGSWGYQVTGFFAPTSRYGTPREFMALIDYLHQRGIGVILDWVPAHFPSDEHGLSFFDGTHLFEHADPRQGFHPEWHSFIFNYERDEVRSFLVSSAMFWLDLYHADALRVDGVASMLYLDYAREEGGWIPNEHGGRENLGALKFLRQLNEAAYEEFPDVQTIAEESTSWPMVTRPTHLGGLGFGMKWDLGWMHDTLKFLGREPIHRRWHMNELTFRTMYQFDEHFVLPLSHDEVVHEKGSLLRKMDGDEWQRLANLRVLYAYQWALPGKKLMFMGAELAQWNEWNHDASLDWHLAELPAHAAIGTLIGHLNAHYRAEASLFELDTDAAGFAWVLGDDEQSVYVFARRAKNHRTILVILNLTPVARYGFRVGVELPGYWQELLNTDAAEYGGSGVGNLGGAQTQAVPSHGYDWSLAVTLPPCAALYLAAPKARVESVLANSASGTAPGVVVKRA